MVCESAPLLGVRKNENELEACQWCSVEQGKGLSKYSVSLGSSCFMPLGTAIKKSKERDSRVFNNMQR